MLAARNLRVTSAPKPHVLFVLADDLGHNNLGYSAVKEAQPFAHSPNLDALVADGVKLDRYYTCVVPNFCSICAILTRAALAGTTSVVHHAPRSRAAVSRST